MTLRVLILDDDPDVRWSLRATCADAGCEVFEADSLAAGRKALERQPDLVLLDLMLPDGSGLAFLPEALRAQPGLFVVVMSGYATVERAVEAMSQGAFHFLAKPFSSDLLMTLLDRARELMGLRYALAQQRTGGPRAIVPRGALMRQVEAQVQKLAPSNAKIMLLGPSGAGKTFYAQRMHQLSGRKGAFVAANCGAINPGVIESELFGHERGAFTDAHQLKRGYFEQADGGTLLLDEIGDMPLDLQVKLLKVVEENRIVRMGGEGSIPIDVRLICATHQDLGALVRQKRFREDLYYRLNVGVIVVPPLRERGYEDFLALAEAEVARLSEANGKHFTRIDPRAGELLFLYPWPGNVRELKNILERIVILEDADSITVDHVRAHLVPLQHAVGPGEGAPGFAVQEPYPELEELKAQYYDFMLEECAGNLTQAAKRLGVSRKTLERYQSEKGGRA